MSGETHDIGPKKRGESQISDAISRWDESEIDELRRRPKGASGQVYGEELPTEKRVRGRPLGGVVSLKGGDDEEEKSGDAARRHGLIQRHFRQDGRGRRADEARVQETIPKVEERRRRRRTE